KNWQLNPITYTELLLHLKDNEEYIEFLMFLDLDRLITVSNPKEESTDKTYDLALYNYCLAIYLLFTSRALIDYKVALYRMAHVHDNMFIQHTIYEPSDFFLVANILLVLFKSMPYSHTYYHENDSAKLFESVNKGIMHMKGVTPETLTAEVLPS